jgi:hypothetical protein
VAGALLPSRYYPRAPLRKKGAGAYEKSRVHPTTTFSSCLTNSKISHPYPPHLNHPPRPRDPLIFHPLRPPALPNPPSCHVSDPSRGGESVRDLRALAPVILRRVYRQRGMRHPVLLHFSLNLRPGPQVGFFDLRRRQTQRQVPH